jgi:hypothetical protein
MPTQPRSRNDKKLLNPEYNLLASVVQFYPDEVYKRIDAMLPTFDEYTAGPDIWFNFGALAGQVDHDRAQYEFAEAGLREHPNDVDLLCSQFQQFYAKSDMYYSPLAARERWEYLRKLPIEQTGPMWRFWVFGATYHSLELKNTAAAERLLREGLSYVRRGNLMNILRAFRFILLAGPPSRIVRFEDLAVAQTDLFHTVENQFLQGINMGVEDSYVLALEIAEMYQERAGVTSVPVANQAAMTAEQRNYLEQALDYLALAERLYNGDSNHPIYDIYIVQARVRMALKEYSKVVNLLQSIPIREQHEPSIATMLNLARQSIGLEPEALVRERLTLEIRAQVEQEVLQELFVRDGQGLESILKQNPDYIAIVVDVLRRLSGGGN